MHTRDRTGLAQVPVSSARSKRVGRPEEGELRPRTTPTPLGAGRGGGRCDFLSCYQDISSVCFSFTKKKEKEMEHVIISEYYQHLFPSQVSDHLIFIIKREHKNLSNMWKEKTKVALLSLHSPTTETTK